MLSYVLKWVLMGLLSQFAFRRGTPSEALMKLLRINAFALAGLVALTWSYRLMAGCDPKFIVISKTVASAAGETHQLFGYHYTGRVWIEPQFERARPFCDGLAAVKKNGKWGYLDKTGRTAIPIRYTLANDFSEQRAFVREENQWIMLSMQGENVCGKKKFFYGGVFSESLAPVAVLKEKGQVDYGYVTRSCDCAIQPHFEMAKSFENGLAPVQFRDRWNLINRDGKEILDFSLDAPPVYHVVDHAGHKLPFWYVKKDGRLGVLSGKGRVVIRPEYHYLAWLKRGAWKVAVAKDKFGLLKPNGEVALEPTFVKIHNLPGEGNWLALLSNKGWRHYNLDKWSLITDGYFLSIDGFYEGLARVQVREETGERRRAPHTLYGFVNEEGYWIIKPQFPEASHFSSGMVLAQCPGTVWMTCHLGYFNKKGERCLSGRRPMKAFPDSKVYFYKWSAGTDFVGKTACAIARTSLDDRVFPVYDSQWDMIQLDGNKTDGSCKQFYKNHREAFHDYCSVHVGPPSYFDELFYENWAEPFTND